jgi:hypothetical protein
MSIVGSYEFFRTGGWILRPGEVTVYLSDTIETAGLSMRDVEALRDRVRGIIGAPLGEHTAVADLPASAMREA